MSYIAKHIVGADEHLIGVARLHKIYLISGLFWGGIFVGAGIFIATMMQRYEDLPNVNTRVLMLGYDLGPTSMWLFGAFAVTGVLIFLLNLINVMATEVALTSRRVIYKRGWIMVEVEQIELEEIESERIRHGIFGSLLGYGSILLDCRFIKDIQLPAIRAPYKFIRAMHKERERHDTQAEGARHNPKS